MSGYSLTPPRFGPRLNLNPGLPESVKAYSVTGDGTTDDYAALNEVAIKFGTTGHVYFPAGTYRVGTTLTFNCLCEFAPGATFDPDSGVTVTLAGPIRVAPGSSIVRAGTTGTVSITGPMDAGSGTLNVKAFGAVGDGVTDDTAAIQRAGTAAAVAGVALIFPAGTYVIATSVVVQGDYDSIKWVGLGNVILDGRTSTQSDLVLLGGTAGTPVGLTASPVKGDVVVSSTLAASLVAGDMVHVVSTAAFSPVSAFFVKGELAEVEGTSGNNITLRTALYDSYSSANTTVTKVNAPRVVFENINVLRNSNHRGLSITYGRDLSLRDWRVSGARAAGTSLTLCVGGVLENGGSDDVYSAGLGLNYGLAINSCQWLTVVGGVYYGGRHAVSHGGTTPVRGMTYYGGTFACDVVDSSVSSFDVHDATEYTVIDGCTIFGGIVGGFRNIRIANNRLQQVTDEPTILGSLSSSSDYVIIEGNNGESQDAGFGVRLLYAAASVTVQHVRIANNTFIGASGIVISDETFAGAAITKLAIADNFVRATGTTQSALSIGAASATLVVADAEINGGFYEAATNTVVLYRPHASSRTVRYIGATIKAAGNVRPLTSYNAQHTTITACRFEQNGFATNSFVLDSPHVVLRDNYFYNCGANGGFTLSLTVLSVTICQESGNVLDTCVGAFAASAGGIFVDYQTSTGRRVGRGTAAPVAGTWAVGDTVWNTAPVAAGVPGWMCTTGGTPGTWKAMANLAA